MNLRERFLLVLALMCFAGFQAFALEVTGSPPGGEGLSTAQTNDIEDAFWGIVGDINDEIKNIDANPEKLIKGFADASTFSALGATQRAYGEYKLWAFTIGPMVGIRLPGSNISGAIDEIQNVGDTLEEDGDIKAGLNIQGITGQFSLNTSKFLLDNLYLGIRFGYFNLKAVENLEFKTFHIGLTGNYQLLKGTNVVSGLFRWRGVNVGAGLIFQRTTLGYTYELDRQEGDISGGSGGRLYVDPAINFDMKINTFIIPLEVNTSAQLLWVLNLNLGLGVDVAFGKNTTTLNMSGDINGDTASGITTPGYLTVDAGGSMGPTIFNPKVMANIGFKFGPVIIDVPVTYYFVGGPGFSVGITLGAVW
ncbi:MAG: hypothetical protein LBK74_06805 [Treponema sp.]|jgi:hypothetical protein|nr:hypothetical protein [Treponema sp.]